MNSTKKITYTGLFAAIGIILPQAFHMIGGPAIGSVLLPMHIPVIVGAMLLGPMSGVVIALISVIVGAILGMPPMPMAIFMVFELSAYGLMAGYLHNQKKFNPYVSLVGAMIAGRMVQLLVIHLFLRLFNASLPPVFGTLAMFVTGIPGMVLQFVLVPILVVFLIRFTVETENVYE